MEPTLTLAELETGYLDHHRALGHSPSTINHYQATFSLLHRCFADHPLDSCLLTTESMQHFARWLRDTATRPQRGERQRSEVSVHGHLKDMRAFVRWLNTENLLTRVVKVPMPKLPQRLFPILNEEDLEKVWNSSFLKGHGALCIRNRAMIGLMLDTGLRRAEVASLTLPHLDLDNRLLTVIGRGNKERKVSYSHNVKLLLQSWITTRGNDDGSLFWLSGAGIRTTFRRIELETHIKAFYPHQVRHTAASIMVRNNIDPFTLQQILGHADLATTQRYDTQSDDDLRTKHTAASPFDTVMRRRIEEQAVTKRRRISRTG